MFLFLPKKFIILSMSYTKEQSLAEITQLVANFRANEACLNDVPEAQIESDYIRKLFRFLNWNTENTGLSVSEWEFVLQRTDDTGKRPDYFLQLDGQQVLVMDAKKVKYDMHDPRWMTQVYAYAYSSQNLSPSRKIDFAILTDFQEFVLLDCTLFAAEPKAVSNFRILDWRYPDYISQFDTLWELLERENVRAALKTRGSQNPLGLWSRYLSPKKVKANRIPPDKAFLSEMDDDQTGWRVRLAKDMKKHNPQADGVLITAAVQLLINRLIFVKALSDREIEIDYLTQMAEQVEKAGLAENDTGWFLACQSIFERLNRFYNGSIFARRPELEAVSVSNKVVRNVLRDMMPENSPYNFSVLPVEILGTIYERFLGRVVRTTEQRVKIEDKPEVRKAGGVYYTPQYIVDYIVEHTVGKLLAECKSPADVAKLKILDPACGSGSFLLGAYTALIRWHQDYYSDKERLTQRDREAAYYDSDGRVRLTAKLKRQILQNNLFGVDIDAQAVEVTRFSLSLKALEDTRKDELKEELTLFKQTVLPDLSQNIKCGNSLIGPDFFTGNLFADPAELLRVNPFDWKKEFAQIMQIGGFDAVIGNPPYIRIQRISHADADYLYNTYKSPTSKTDISLVFIEKSLSIVSTNGLIGLICTSQWLATDYGKNLRSMLSDGRLHSIVDFGSLPVFEQAQTYPAIFILSPTPVKKLSVLKIIDKSELTLLGIKLAKIIDVSLDGLSDMPWNMGQLDIISVLKRNNITWKTLNCFGSAYIGVLTGMDNAFVVDGELVKQLGLESDLLYPYAYRGAEIERYKPVCPNSFVIYPYREGQKGSPKLITETELQLHYPNIFKHLLLNKEILKKRLDSRKLYANGADWYRHLRAGSYDYIKPNKLIIKGVDLKATVGILGENTTFNGANCPGIIFSNLEGHLIQYFIGLLNSKVVTYYLRMICPAKLNNYRRFNANNINAIPLPVINSDKPENKHRHDRMVQLVDSMLELHKHKAAATTQVVLDQIQRQIEVTDRQIDALVYELYGLTEDEIAIVEARK
jgi:type I restriction-modification system DNA methylase subunit